MEGDAPTYRRELEMCWHRRGLEVGRDGQVGAQGGGGNRARDAASVRLLGLLADRLLRHREPEALLLKGWYVEKVWTGER